MDNTTVSGAVNLGSTPGRSTKKLYLFIFRRNYMEVKIIEFNKKYSDEIYKLQTEQWGVWDDESKIQKAQQNEIILIALYKKQFAGFVTGQLEKDIFHLKINCVKPCFQKLGIGTLLLKAIIEKAKALFNFAKFRAEAISVYGKCNAKKLLENFHFNHIRTDKGYWGKLYPEVLCLECFKKPCECDSLVYELKNNKG